MAKYVANVQAKVDFGGLKQMQSMLETIEKSVNNINTTGININVSGLNLNNIVNQINSQLGKAGTTAGSQMAKGINNSVNSVSNSVGNNLSNNINKAVKSIDMSGVDKKIGDISEQLSKSFSDLNIDGTSLANSIDKELNSAIIKVDKLKATAYSSGKINFDITGTNELGEAKRALIEVYETLDEAGKKTGNFKSEIQSISLVNNDVSGVKAQAEAYKELESAAKECATAEKVLAEAGTKYDSNSDYYKQLASNLETAQKKFESLKTANKDLVSDSQIAELDKLASAEQKVLDITAKFSTDSDLAAQKSAETAAIKEQAEAFSKLMSIGKQIDSLNLKLLKTDPSDSATIQNYSNELKELETEYSKLKSELSGSLTSGQLDKLGSSLGEAQSKLSETAAKIEDLKAKAAKSVQLKLESGTIDAQFSKIESDLASLKAKGSSSVDSLSQSFERLKSQKNALDGLSGEELVSGYKNLEVEITKFNSALTVAKNNAKQFASATDISKTSSSFETWLSKNSKALDKYGDKIDEVRQQLAKFKEVGATTSELNNVKTAIDNIKTTAASQGNLGVTWVDKLGDQFKKLSTYVSAASVIYTGIRAIKDMVEQVRTIDTSLVELKKVTDETDDTYSQFLDNAKSKAIELGTTVSDLVSATADFARLGYSIQEATNLAQVATIYANVGDDVGSIDEASSSIISTLKAFNIEAESAITVVDKFNEV